MDSQKDINTVPTNSVDDPEFISRMERWALKEAPSSGGFHSVMMRLNRYNLDNPQTNYSYSTIPKVEDKLLSFKHDLNKNDKDYYSKIVKSADNNNLTDKIDSINIKQKRIPHQNMQNNSESKISAFLVNEHGKNDNDTIWDYDNINLCFVSIPVDHQLPSTNDSYQMSSLSSERSLDRQQHRLFVQNEADSNFRLKTKPEYLNINKIKLDKGIDSSFGKSPYKIGHENLRSLPYNWKSSIPNLYLNTYYHCPVARLSSRRSNSATHKYKKLELSRSPMKYEYAANNINYNAGNSSDNKINRDHKVYNIHPNDYSFINSKFKNRNRTASLSTTNLSMYNEPLRLFNIDDNQRKYMEKITYTRGKGKDARQTGPLMKKDVESIESFVTTGYMPNAHAYSQLSSTELSPIKIKTTIKKMTTERFLPAFVFK
ncbi:hypothetical protein GJ496_004994 [Pomphorhynchus laevis]|nr:hypothetical protein GJ496_004994 [Pomphorhynchus laevis]